jgi:pyruvate decarboxylase
VQRLSREKLPKFNKVILPPRPIPSDLESKDIVQSWIWHRIGEFLQPGDVLLTESGTAQFGMPDALFPDNIIYITQQFYSSIGYTVGATLGAALAMREKMKGSKVDFMQDGGIHNRGHGRVILIVGDGSLQMTVQEIGTMIRMGLTPIMYDLIWKETLMTSFLINNDGYSIERCIYGPERVPSLLCCKLTMVGV